MDLSFIMVPFFTGLVAFSLALFHNVSAINIESITVPGSISSKSGYTADVVIKRLVDRMRTIELEAGTRADAKQVMVKDKGGSAAVLGDFFNLTPMLRVVQTSFGLIPYTFSGEIVVNGNELEMVLRGSDDRHKETLIRESSDLGDVPGLIDKVAYEAVRMVDPSIIASYQFKKDYLTHDFTPTEEVIRRALALDDKRPHKWVTNLWGIVLYQETDNEGAIEKFKQALEIDPTFASPLLNWGVVLARQGKYQEAIGKFMQVVEKWNSGDHAENLAAAYSEWGFSLALLGHTDEAYAKFRQATEADPTFADVYSSWAEVLSAAGQADNAQLMTARALRLAPVERVSTDNLIGRIQTLPAVAGRH